MAIIRSTDYKIFQPAPKAHTNAEVHYLSKIHQDPRLPLRTFHVTATPSKEKKEKKRNELEAVASLCRNRKLVKHSINDVKLRPHIPHT